MFSKLKVNGIGENTCSQLLEIHLIGVNFFNNAVCDSHIKKLMDKVKKKI